MHRLPYRTPPKWWPSSISPWLVRMLRPLRRRRLRRTQRVVELEVRGQERLEALLREGAGVMIICNHAGDGDTDAIYELADRIDRPFHFMAAWQVFVENGRFGAWLMQRHGCFSVDREGADMRALKHAVELLSEHDCPVVIFAEGETYHLNDRIMPFREGPAAISLMAARKARRRIVCLPVATKFFYVEDPTESFNDLMGRLEEHFHWRRLDGAPLAERIYRFAEGALALKELEYLGHTKSGPLPDRVGELAVEILSGIETRYGIEPKPDDDLPERIKKARQQAIKGFEDEAAGSDERKQYGHDLDDLFLVCQLMSYPGDYVKEEPTLERIGETLTKFEEDGLSRFRPPPPTDRRAVVSVGEPIEIAAEKKKGAAAELTRELERQVQRLLDEINDKAAPVTAESPIQNSHSRAGKAPA